MKIQIVVVGPNCWGAGKSMRQAVAKARINFPAGLMKDRSGRMPYNAYEASDDFDVGPSGTITGSRIKRIREVRYEGDKQIVRVGKKILGD